MTSDVVCQPRKAQRHYPAHCYVMVEDKLRIGHGRRGAPKAIARPLGWRTWSAHRGSKSKES